MEVDFFMILKVGWDGYSDSSALVVSAGITEAAAFNQELSKG